MRRHSGLDALRGLFLLLMTLTHLPTVAARYTSQPFGYVSNAEGFVFLSAFLVGLIYSARAATAPAQITGVLWRRAGKLYGYHLLTLAFAFSIVAWLAVSYRRPALQNLLGYYLSQPAAALHDALWLLYCPPLLDILPLYIVFLLISPAMLVKASRGGWIKLLLGSGLIWLLAQFGLREWVRDFASWSLGMQLPSLRQLGAFDLFAWQLLWVGGLYLGAQTARRPDWPDRIPRWLMLTAAGLAMTLLSARHWLGPVPADWRWLVTKWHLGPIRLVEVAALTLLLARWGGAITSRLPIKPLAFLGRSSLPVFTAHIVTCLMALSLIRTGEAPLAPSLQAMVAGIGIAVLFAVAAWDQAWDRGWRPWPRPSALAEGA